MSLSNPAQKITIDSDNYSKTGWTPFSIVLIYVLFGFLWILLSDKILQWFINDAETLNDWQTVKGWFYVLITAGLLFFLINRMVKRITGIERIKKESDKKYSLLVENSNEGIWMIDSEIKLTFLNQKLAEMLGYSVSELLGKSGFIFVDGIDHREAEQILSRLKSGRKEQFDFRLKRKDGSDLWVFVSASPIIENGLFAGSLGMITDITDRKIAEEKNAKLNAELNKQQQRLNSIVMNVPGVVWEIRMEPETEKRVIEYISDYTKPMLGYTVEEWMADQSLWYSIIYKDDREEILRHSQEILDDPKAEKGIQHYRLVRKDGQIVWVESQMQIKRNNKGVITHLHGVTVDITDRRQAEEKLRISEERFRSLLNATSQIIWTTDAYGRGLNARTKSGKLVEGIGPNAEQEWFDRLHPEDKARAINDFRQCVQNKTPYKSQYRLFNFKDNSYHYFISRGTPVFEKDGTVREWVGTLIDITKTTLAENALRESEERFRTLADTAPVLIWMTGPNKLYDYVNKTFLDFTGRKLEEEIGKGWAEGLHPEDLEKCLGDYIEAFEKQEEFKSEYRLRRSDGEYRWVIGTGVPRFTPDGEFIGYIGTCLDITERKLAEEELSKQKERLEKIATASPIGIISFRKSPEGKWSFPFLSPAASDIYGFQPELLKEDAQPVLDLIHLNDVPKLMEANNGSIRTISVWNETFRYHHPHKGERWIEGFQAPVLDTDGGITWHGIILDITNRREREIEIKKMAAIVQSSNDAIIGEDIEGTITSWNYGAVNIFGYTAEEVIGKNIKILYPQDRIAEESEIIGKIKRGLHTTQFETVRRKKDGTIIQVSLTVSPIRDENGEIIGISKIGRDITQQKLTEQMILQMNEMLEKRVKERTSELEAANRELESFSYSVSHDLRAPLRGIDGFSRILLEDYAGQLDAEACDYLQRVRESSQRMGQLIEDMLNLSRVARSEIRRKEVNLTRLTRKIVEKLEESYPERRVEFNIEENLQANCDEHLLRIVLENLLDNAWKFTSKNESAKITFGKTGNGRQPEFFIEDNGAGFDMRYADKLFGAFQRLHNQNEFKGTGIGLATVQRIIHRHGGTVRAEGETGKGAKFYFTL